MRTGAVLREVCGNLDRIASAEIHATNYNLLPVNAFVCLIYYFRLVRKSKTFKSKLYAHSCNFFGSDVNKYLIICLRQPALYL